MKCVVLQPIDAIGHQVLTAGGVAPVKAPSTNLTNLAPLLADADAVITRNWGFPAEALALAPALKVVAVHGTGTDRIAKAELARRGVALATTPGANAQSVAEHALGLLLAVARAIPQAHQAMQSDDFDFRERFRGVEQSGRCLGLWGWGSVSQLFAPMARALGMDVLVLSDHAGDADLVAWGCRRADGLAAFLAQADVVSLHGRPGDLPVLGAGELAQMRRGAIVLNTARGALVDEAALAEALRAGRLLGAGLDVLTQEPPDPSSPLIGCPGVVLTPHMGGSTVAAQRRMAEQSALHVLAALGRAAP